MPDKGQYPARIEQVKRIEMDPEHADIYRGVTQGLHPALASKVRANMPLNKRELSQLNAFMTAARIISNSPKPYGGSDSSNKMDTVVADIIEELESNPKHKTLTYSNYLDGGVRDVAARLEERGIPYALFTGELSDKQRKEIVADYNAGKIRALLISGAGAEGIDLKGTTLAQVGTKPGRSRPSGGLFAISRMRICRRISVRSGSWPISPRCPGPACSSFWIAQLIPRQIST